MPANNETNRVDDDEHRVHFDESFNNDPLWVQHVDEKCDEKHNNDENCDEQHDEEYICHRDYESISVHDRSDVLHAGEHTHHAYCRQDGVNEDDQNSESTGDPTGEECLHSSGNTSDSEPSTSSKRTEEPTGEQCLISSGNTSDSEPISPSPVKEESLIDRILDEALEKAECNFDSHDKFV